MAKPEDPTDHRESPEGFDRPDGLDREARYGQFVGLLARHDEAIRRFVRSLLPSRDGVDDVMQETALECWRKYAQFEPTDEQEAVDEFVRWACVIARYKALSWQRDKSRDRLVFRESVIELLADSCMTSLARQEDERKAIESCLGKMEDEPRRLVLSVHSPGQSVALIAKQTGQKARKLYSRVNVLRKQLLHCVEQTLALDVSSLDVDRPDVNTTEASHG